MEACIMRRFIENFRCSAMQRITGTIITAFITIWLGAGALCAQQPAAGTPAADKGSFFLTIFLRHDESKTLDQINAQLKAQGFYKAFPPDGTEVVSWYV